MPPGEDSDQPNVSHANNSHVLTCKNPCINQAIHVPLMQGFCTLHIFAFKGVQQMLMHSKTCLIPISREYTVSEI